MIKFVTAVHPVTTELVLARPRHLAEVPDRHFGAGRGSASVVDTTAG